MYPVLNLTNCGWINRQTALLFVPVVVSCSMYVMGVPQLLFYFGGYFEQGYLACRSTSTLKLLLYILRSTIITVNYQSFYSFLNLYVGQEGSPTSRALWRRVKMQFVSIFDEKATTVCQKILQRHMIQQCLISLTHLHFYIIH